MNFKIVASVFVFLYFSFYVHASMQSFELETDNSKITIQESASIDTESTLKQTASVFWKQFLQPGFNIVHLVLFSGLILLYLRSRKLKRRLLRTRSKLHNQSVRFTQRLDNLTLEQKELKKIIKDYAELQY